MTDRRLQRIIDSIAASEGAGVKLRRSLGARPHARLDPFLMLDEFFSDDPDDYAAGFPDHPHRGFETVTYMLDGHMQHRDHLGNTGDLGPGGVQWMTAGRGIIHSEMPQQKEGRLRGFQLWLNLPAAEKMKPASYRDIPAGEIPAVALAGGGSARVIAGRLGGVAGPVVGGATDAHYFDVRLPADGSAELPLPAGYSAFAYVYEGSLALPGGEVGPRQAGVLTDGTVLRLPAQAADVRLLLLAGRPLGEPVVQYGPFVMNTTEEINQALRDYRDGTLAAPA